MLKKGLCILLAVIMLVSLSGCRSIEEFVGGAFFLFLIAASDDRAEKETIIAYVQEHEEELLSCIEENDYSALQDHSIIKDVDADETVVDFSCGGAGVGSGTSYCGFYYSANNNMDAIWCAPPATELTPAGDGFAWQEEGGDNRYYTEKICEYFYYYEASF